MWIKFCEGNIILHLPKCESSPFYYCLFQQLPLHGLEAGGSRRKSFNPHPNALNFSNFPALNWQRTSQLTPVVSSTCSKNRKSRGANSNLPDGAWFTGSWQGGAGAQWLLKSFLELARIYSTFYARLNHSHGHFCKRSTFRPNQYGKL